jgi:hypothetical protein
MAARNDDIDGNGWRGELKRHNILSVSLRLKVLS